jgi:hypothetical protein
MAWPRRRTRDGPPGLAHQTSLADERGKQYIVTGAPPGTRTPNPRILRVRCSAFPHVHRRPPIQVTCLYEPPWTVLDAGELQLKLQRGLLRGNPARRRFQISEPALGGHGGWRVRRPSCPVTKPRWRRRVPGGRPVAENCFRGDAAEG